MPTVNVASYNFIRRTVLDAKCTWPYYFARNFTEKKNEIQRDEDEIKQQQQHADTKYEST